MTTIDLNCDLGEGFGAWEMGNDAAMIELATSVNIACGFHAGDADTMRKIVGLAKARGVSIGAHPGYRDLPGFGCAPRSPSPAVFTPARPIPCARPSGLPRRAASRSAPTPAIATCMDLDAGR